MISIGTPEKGHGIKGKKSLLETISSLEERHRSTENKEVYEDLIRHRRLLQTVENSDIQKDLLFTKQQFWQQSSQSWKFLAAGVKIRKRQNNNISFMRF